MVESSYATQVVKSRILGFDLISLKCYVTQQSGVLEAPAVSIHKVKLNHAKDQTHSRPPGTTIPQERMDSM